jgi:hypothetical protein
LPDSASSFSLMRYLIKESETDMNNFPNIFDSPDGIFSAWLVQSNVPSPAKELFMELPDMAQAYVETSSADLLTRFVARLKLIASRQGGRLDVLPLSLQLLASDCFVLLGELLDAIKFFPSLPIGPRASTQTDSLLSLKLATEDRISARDVLTLYGPKVTKYGNEHLEEIAEQITLLLDALWTETSFNHIKDWAKNSYSYQYQVFIGWPIGYYLTKMTTLSAYTFSNNRDASKFVSDIAREAENRVRYRLGIPRVGEGWVSETKLYYEIKQAFPNEDVLQHASPLWLGKQHLDIFLPAHKVAIEYQGTQHDRPVDYFGGQNAFEQTQKRDELKRRLCARNGIALIYVQDGYLVSQVLRRIAEFAAQSS